MSQKTIIRHTCDHCGKTQEEEQTNWLNTGGPKNWSGWDIKQKGTASCFYGTMGQSVEFCCYDCAIKWMKEKIEWQLLTT